MNYKTIFAPLIAVIAIAIQLVFGIELPQELQNDVLAVIINGIAVCTAIYGIFKNHKS